VSPKVATASSVVCHQRGMWLLCVAVAYLNRPYLLTVLRRFRRYTRRLNGPTLATSATTSSRQRRSWRGTWRTVARTRWRSYKPLFLRHWRGIEVNQSVCPCLILSGKARKSLDWVLYLKVLHSGRLTLDSREPSLKGKAFSAVNFHL